MRKVVAPQFVTLNSVMEAPHESSFPYWAMKLQISSSLSSKGAKLNSQ